MSFASLIGRVVDCLDRHRIPYMLAGSLAAGVYGVLRATNDIDLVVDPPGTLPALCDDLVADGLVVSHDAAAEALHARGMFNAIDPETGWKVDFIVRRDRAFSRVEFERRQPTGFAGRELFVATAEDVVISKLDWARSGGSARQIEDVRRIVAFMADDLDRRYVEHWVTALGLGAQWGAATAP